MNAVFDFSHLSDEELIARVKEAEQDLLKAAIHQEESEWHEACFAGLMIYVKELNKRGLKIATVH